MPEHLTIPGALEWDTVERHSIATLRYAGGKEHDVKYVSEVAYDALNQRMATVTQLLREAYEAGDHNVFGTDLDARLSAALKDSVGHEES